jgi:hypothetical protein
MLLPFEGSAQPTTAEAETRKEERILEQFRISLKSEIPGIVEATIYDLLAYEKLHPSTDCSGFVAQLDELEHEHAAPAVSYKAYLAKMVVLRRSLIEFAILHGEDAPQDTFRRIADQLKERMLVSNEQATD